MSDCRSKGRWDGLKVAGERGRRAKFKDAQIVKLREGYRLGLFTAASKARELGVKSNTLIGALIGKSYKHV